MICNIRFGQLGRVVLLFVLSVAPLAACPARSHAAGPGRTWTVYLAQDKHLDYNWCGSTTEIELRMAALVDYYLDQAEQESGR